MTELWERWVGSTAPPTLNIQRGARVRTETRTITVGRDLLDGACTAQIGRRWITFAMERAGVQLIVDMPENAPTKSCAEARHDDCAHRLGGRAEGGELLKAGLSPFVWRCGCACHNDPTRAGFLF